jgi:hypothetical protein
MIKKQGRLVGLDTQLQSLAPSRLSAGVPGAPEPIIEQIAPGFVPTGGARAGALALI